MSTCTSLACSGYGSLVLVELRHIAKLIGFQSHSDNTMEDYESLNEY